MNTASAPRNNSGRAAVLASAVLALTAVLPAAAAEPGQPDDSEGWLSEARQRIDDQEYEITWQGGLDQAWQAPNRTHGFRAYFMADEIRVVPRTGEQTAWRLGLRLVGFGRGEEVQPLERPQLAPNGPRIEYRRGNLYEWYVNRREGLEHGFTLYAPPGGPRYETLVRLDVALTGDLLPLLSADGQAVDFVAGGAPLAVLHYGKLLVQDATENALPSWMELVREGGAVRIRLVFDDAKAVYPVTVDPLLTGPAWQAEGNQTEARFGAAVAGAGDVNCDGYDDVLVAAPHFDAGQTDEGQVFVFHGSASGLGATPAWWAESNQTDAAFGGFKNDQELFGGPVAGAGNINRDGVCRGGTNPGTACTPGAASTCTGGGICRGCDDVVIGAPDWDEPGMTNAGLAVVYFGSPTGLNKSGTRPVGDSVNADLRIKGEAANANRGFSVAGTGDTNGDGFGGILVGEPGYSSGKGRVLVRLYTGSGWTSCEYTWPTNGEYFGHSVTGGGDFNGDGYADVAAAVPGAWSQRGILVVYFGRTGDGVCRTASDPAASCPDYGVSPPQKCWLEIVSKIGVPATPGAGPQSLAFLGNVNGDGYDDLVIGGKAYGAGGNKGAVFVYYGKANPWGTPTGTDRSDWRRVGSTLVGDPFLGASVSAAGDVNGDGFDDLLVGSPNADACGASTCDDTGSAYLWLGKTNSLPDPTGKASEDDAAPYPDWKTDGSQIGERLGVSAAAAGDVNGDGLDDIILGARNYDGDMVDEGRAVVYHGTTGGRINVLDLARHVLEVAPSSTIVAAGAVYNAKRCVNSSAFCTSDSDCPGSTCAFDPNAPPNPDTIWTDDRTAWSPAVGHGPVPHSVVLSTGLALDMGRGDTDLVPVGADHVQWVYVVQVPAGICDGGSNHGNPCAPTLCPGGGVCQPTEKTLRFTTQFVTSEFDRQPRKQDTVSFWFKRNVTEAPGTVNLHGIAALSSRRENPPIAHGLRVDDVPGQQIKVAFRISDKDDGRYDSALIVSRMFFSDIPLPDGEGIFMSNPAPQDVGLATGTFTYDKKLYEVPGIGLPFEFSVRYNSASGESDVLGPKWVHSYQASVQKTTVKELVGSCSAPAGWACDTAADCNAGATCSSPTERDVDLLIVRPGTGGAEYFSRRGGGYRTKYPGTYSTIVENTVDQKFTYTTKDRVQYVFERDSGLTKLRLLKSFKDKNNNTITLNYTSDNKIDYVLDTRGQTFSFNYSGGKLTSVQGSGAQATFAYHGLTGYLRGLTDLNGYATSFTYDERGNLLTLTDADGVTFTTNEYETYQGNGVDQVGDRVVKRRNAKPGDTGIDVAFSGDTLTRTDRVDGKEIERQDVKDRLHEKKVLLGTLPNGNDCDESIPLCWARTETAYYADNNPSRQIDPRQTTALMSYDALGNLTARTDASGRCAGGPNVGNTCTLDDACPGSSCGVRVEMDYRLCSAGAKVGEPCGSDGECAGNTCLPTPWIARRGFHPATAGSCQGPAATGTCYRYTYDAKGNLVKEVDEGGRFVTYGYPSSNNKGLPDWMTDRRGSRWDYTYNPLGQRDAVFDPDPDDAGPLGRPVTRYGYDVMGRVISIWDPFNSHTSFEYDAGGRKIAEWDPLENRTVYEYDAWGRPTLITDPTGLTISHTYTITGRLKDTTRPLGIVHRYYYDLEDRLTSERDPMSQTTTYTCDLADRLVGVEDPLLGTVSAAYDAMGNLVEVTDPEGSTTVYAYDLLNRRTEETELTNTVRTDYTPRGDIAKSTNARGQTVTYTYDDAGRLTGVTLPSRAITHVLDNNANQISTTDPLFPQSPPGSAIQRTFDRLDRPTSRRDPFGRTVGYTYDLAGNVVQITYPSGFVVNYAYDAAKRLVGVTHLGPSSFHSSGANGTVFVVALQPDGKVVIGGAFTTVNGATRNRIARLNADGSLDATFQNGMAGTDGTLHDLALLPDGKLLIGGLFWSVNGVPRQSIARLNADGSLDATFQNEMAGADGWVDSVAVQPDGKVVIGGSFNFVNGEFRNRIARLNADGSLDTTFQTDVDGETVHSLALQPDGKLLIAGWFWSVNFEPRQSIARLNNNGSLDATFQNGMAGADAEVISVALQPDGRVLIGGCFTWVNNATRNGIARLNADGSLDVTFQNGMAGADQCVNAVAVQPDQGVLIGGAFTTVNSVTRNRIARLNADGSLDVTFQNGMAGADGTVHTLARQLDGQVLLGGDFTSVNGVTRTRIARLSSTGGLNVRATAYLYDAAGKVTRANIPDGSSVTYSYDAAQRLAGITDGTIYQAALIRDAADRILKATETLPLEPTIVGGDSTFTYPPGMANRLSGATYDNDGNLTQVTLDGVGTTFQYDALNRLVQVDRAGVRTIYRYDADGLRVETVRDGLSKTYVYDVRNGQLLEEYEGTGLLPTARYVWGHGLIGRETSAGWRFYHFDHRSNTVALTNDTGQITDWYAYDPYGLPAGSRGLSDNPFRFVGRAGVFDEGNGLLFMRNRHYSPELMRFLQKDQAVAGELKDPQSLNRYAYVQGDPILYIDPDGEFITKCIFGGYECSASEWRRESVMSVLSVAGLALAVATATATAPISSAVAIALAIQPIGLDVALDIVERKEINDRLDTEKKAAEEAKHETLAQDAEKERIRPKSPVQSLSPDVPAPCR